MSLVWLFEGSGDGSHKHGRGVYVAVDRNTAKKYTLNSAKVMDVVYKGKNFVIVTKNNEIH